MASDCEIIVADSTNLFTSGINSTAATLSSSMSSSSAEEQHKLFILNAIDKLRERKARPDVDRITALVYRQHKLQRNTSASILEKLVDHGAVVRVEYKGSVSYRNAAKWKRSSLSGSVLNSSVTSQRLADALRSLTFEREPEMQDIGFTFEDIEEALLRQPMPPNLARSHSQVSEEGDSDSSDSGGSHEDELRGDTLRRALERESTAGSFVRLPGDRFALDNDGSRRQSIAEHMAKRPIKMVSSVKKETANPINNFVKETNLSVLIASSTPGLKLIAPAPLCVSDSARTPLIANSSASFNFSHHPMGLASLPAVLPPPPPHLPRSSQLGPLSLSTSSPNQAESVSGQPLTLLTSDNPVTQVVRYATTAPADLQHTHPNVPLVLSIQPQGQPVPKFNRSQSIPVPSSVSSQMSQNTSSTNGPAVPKRGRPLGSKKKSNVQSSGVVTHVASTKRARLNSSDHYPTSLTSAQVPTQGSHILSQCSSIRCDFCLSSSPPLLCCQSCSARAHPACMNYNSELSRRVQMGPWQCSECKICCVCEDASNPELMLICDGCDKGYHLSCHLPSICEKPPADIKWVCSHCQASNGFAYDDKISEPSSSSSTTLMKIEADVACWGIEETALWLQEQGFSSAANIFRDQEVDGASLLLMKRMDVLTGLGLKLGPAVKIYDKIRQLQVQGRMMLTCD